MGGGATTRQATGTLTLLTLGAVFGTVFLVLIARRLKNPQEEPGRSPISLLKQTVVHTGEGLSDWGPLAINILLAALQVALVVLSFWAILPALGLEIELSILAVCGVIGLGSIASVVLPPSFGAGTAATGGAGTTYLGA